MGVGTLAPDLVAGTLEHRGSVQEMCRHYVGRGEYSLAAQLILETFADDDDESTLLGLANRVLGPRVCTCSEIEVAALCGPSRFSNSTMVQLPASYSSEEKVMTLGWAIGSYVTERPRFDPNGEDYSIGVELIALIYGREQTTAWIRSVSVGREFLYPDLMQKRWLS